MALPTFVAHTPTVFNTATTPKTCVFNVLAGDRLAVVVGSADDASTMNISNDGVDLGWVLEEDLTATSFCRTKLWKATVDSNRTPLTVTLTSSGGNIWGGSALQWRASDGFGASEQAHAVGSPSCVITPQQANSALVFISTDWSAKAGARTYRQVNGVNPTETSHFDDNAVNWGVNIAYHPDAGAIAAYTVGMTAPGSQSYGLLVIEVKGTAAATAALTGTALAAITEADIVAGGKTIIITLNGDTWIAN